MQSEVFRQDIAQIISSIEKIMFGKLEPIKLILISIICNDHILLEDVPGTGKTMLINTIAKILDLDFKRIQGTPDLLPGDLSGVNIYNQKISAFEFIKGPIFTNILLFDEINRASPKTQSALLEAMAESRVSIDNTTYRLDKPFFVIATQNPVEHLGTYPLPQAQLDRFLIKTTIGYPSVKEERMIMLQEESSIEQIQLPKFSKTQLEFWQNEYKKVSIKDELVDKLLNIVTQTRAKDKFKLGISPRASRKLIRALKASAYIHARDFVTKDDIFDLFIPTMAHRIFTFEKGNEESILINLLHNANF